MPDKFVGNHKIASLEDLSTSGIVWEIIKDSLVYWDIGITLERVNGIFSSDFSVIMPCDKIDLLCALYYHLGRKMGKFEYSEINHLIGIIHNLKDEINRAH